MFCRLINRLTQFDITPYLSSDAIDIRSNVLRMPVNLVCDVGADVQDPVICMRVTKTTCAISVVDMYCAANETILIPNVHVQKMLRDLKTDIFLPVQREMNSSTVVFAGKAAQTLLDAINRDWFECEESEFVFAWDAARGVCANVVDRQR